MKKLALLVLAAASFPMLAMASTGGASTRVEPPTTTTAQYGGPPATFTKNEMSNTRILDAINKNMEQLVKGLAGMLDQNSATSDVRNKTGTALSGYNGAEERRTGNMAAGTQMLKEYGASDSYASAMVLSNFDATSGSEAETSRLAYDAFKNYPGRQTVDQNGGGGTHNAAYMLVQQLCQAKVLPGDMATVIGATKAFPGCQKATTCSFSPASMQAEYEGVKVKKGEQSAKCVQAALKIMDFGASISAQQSAYNARSVSELLAMEDRARERSRMASVQNPMLAPAVFNLSDAQQNRLFIRTNTAEASGATIRYIGRVYASTLNASQLMTCLAPNFSIENKGEDIYKDQSDAYTAQTGNQKCYASGMKASSHCEAKMSAGAYRRAAAESVTENQSAGQMNATVFSASNSVETAKNRANNRGECSVATASLQGEFEKLVAVLISPSFESYLASLSDEDIRNSVADARRQLGEEQVQLALNIEKSFRDLAGVRYYAANDPAVKKTPEMMQVADVFDAAGVDMASLMPVSGNGRKLGMYAALLPTLNDRLNGGSGLSQFAANGAGSRLLPGMRFAMDYDGRALSQFAAASAAPVISPPLQ